MPSRVQAPDFPWDFMRRGILGFIQLLVFGALLGLCWLRRLRARLGYGAFGSNPFSTRVGGRR
jgi:hypothetical protein